jgi:hypothetical protein
VSTPLEELRKHYSLLKEVNVKTHTIVGTLPTEADTLVQDIERELVTLEGFDRDARTAWSLAPKKRRLEKEIKDGVPKISDRIDRAVRVHSDVLRSHLDALAAQQGSIIAFDLKLGRDLKALTFPSTKGAASVVLPVLARFVSNLESVTKSLRDALTKQVNDLLERNRALIKTYDRFVGIDTGDVPVSAQRETAGTGSIPELLKMRESIRAEHEYLTSRRGEVVEMLRAKLRSSIESTISLLETARSLNLKVAPATTKQLGEIAKQTDGNTNLTSLLGLAQQFDGQVLKASSEIRSQIMESSHALNRLLADNNVAPDAKFLPPAPPEAAQDADLAALVASFEHFQAYRTNLETALRAETMRILDDLLRAVKRNVLSDNDDLSKFVKTYTKKAGDEKLDSLVASYSLVAARIIDEHGKVLAEIRTQEALLQRIADAATTILDKTTMGAAPAPVKSQDAAFPDLVDAYARLKKHTENRVDLFRKAWERELNALLAEIQVIKPTYRESFKTMEDFLQSAIKRVRASSSLEEIETISREAQSEALYKTQDAIENLKYRLDLKLRLAISKLLGMGLNIPSEAQAAIQELGGIVPASETYEQAVRKAHAIVELFERRIIGYLNQALNEQIKAYSELMQVSANLGIKTDIYANQLVKLQEKLPANIEDIPDRFDELRALLSNPQLLRDVRTKANEVWKSLNSVTNLLERYGQAEIVAKLKGLLARVPDQMNTESVTQMLELCLALVEAQKSVLDIMRNMEQKTSAAYEVLLENTSEYYSTVKRVYAARPREFSKLIFPLATLDNLRERLISVASLTEAIDLFTTLRRLESQWLERLKQLDEWHKALRIFLADFNPVASKADRTRALDDIEKRIRETYTSEDVASYLSWAARELAALMSEKRQTRKPK